MILLQSTCEAFSSFFLHYCVVFLRVFRKRKTGVTSTMTTSKIADTINGIYDPTSEKHGGIETFCKRSNKETQLVYCSDSSHWLVQARSKDGTVRCFAKMDCAGAVHLPYRVPVSDSSGVWSVFKGSRDVDVENSEDSFSSQAGTNTRNAIESEEGESERQCSSFREQESDSSRNLDDESSEDGDSSQGTSTRSDCEYDCESESESDSDNTNWEKQSSVNTSALPWHLI